MGGLDVVLAHRGLGVELGLIRDQHHVAFAIEKLEAEHVAQRLGGGDHRMLLLVQHTGFQQAIHARHGIDKEMGPATRLLFGVDSNGTIHSQIHTKINAAAQHNHAERRDHQKVTKGNSRTVHGNDLAYFGYDG